jgi:uncharacterized RDD family membrane protein YckC
MLPENRFFMIRGEDGQEYGPVELHELREWVQENRAGLGSEVRLDEPGAPWHPWQNYPELIALLAETNAVAPVPGQPTLSIAPVWRRSVAWLMDIMLFAILLNPIQLLLEQVVPMQQILEAMTSPAAVQTMSPQMFHQVMAAGLLDSACLVLYFTVCHALYGRTPAKALLRIKVVDPVGQKPTWVKAFIRALALVLSVNLAFPLVYVFMNPHRRALHDVVADTCVVNA